MHGRRQGYRGPISAKPANDIRPRATGSRLAARPTGTGLAAAGIFWAFWVANFNVLGFAGDAQAPDPERPFSFVRLLFGETDHAFGYQFGLALLWTPFYAVGKLLRAAGVATIDGNSVEIAAITLGTSVLVAATAILLLLLLSSLGVRHRVSVMFLSTFGTPLFFYGTFGPGLSHVPDALLVTAIVLLLFQYLRAASPPLWLAIAIGAVGGYAVTVRIFNGFVVAAVVLGLAVYRRYRGAVTIALSAAGFLGVLVLVPLLLGVSNLTSGYAGSTGQAVSQTFSFSPETVIRMLVSPDWGLFVWTPVTLLGAIGFVVLLRQRPEERPFLVITAGIALSIILPYAFVVFLTQSYSQRYWTPLFPVVALGLAGLVELRPKIVIPAAALAVAWSLVLAFYTAPFTGCRPVAGGVRTACEDGAVDFPRRVANGNIDVADYLDSIYHRARLARLLDDG